MLSRLTISASRTAAAMRLSSARMRISSFCSSISSASISLRSWEAASGSMNTVCPLPEMSSVAPRTSFAHSRFTGSTYRLPRTP